MKLTTEEEQFIGELAGYAQMKGYNPYWLRHAINYFLKKDLKGKDIADIPIRRPSESVTLAVRCFANTTSTIKTAPYQFKYESQDQ